MRSSLVLLAFAFLMSSTVCGQSPPRAPERDAPAAEPKPPAAHVGQPIETPPPAPESRPPQPDVDRDRPPTRGEVGRPVPPRAPLARFAPLLRMIAERRPELAARLRRLHNRDPERLHDVLLDAFMFQLDEALERAERDAGPHGAPPRPEAGGPPPRRPGQREPAPEFELRARELQERHEQLEQRSRELAERLRDPNTPGEARERLHGELVDVVNEQFDVRTELRRVELERIERELRQLRAGLERMQHQIERRERERGAIVERRIQQLLHEDFSGW